MARSEAETLRLLVTLPSEVTSDEAGFKRWGYSLGYALREGIQRLYMLDPREVDFVLEGPWETGKEGLRHHAAALTFVDPALGGAGFLSRAAGEFHRVAAEAVTHLRHSGCDSACYRCLKDYWNQRYHEHLSWPAAMRDLEILAAAPPTARPLQASDLDDPRPWLDAYAAGVGSPLELRFLRFFEARGIAVERQVPVAPTPDAPSISVADFVLAGRRVVVYVDGAAYHIGANLRRDRRIRDQLRGGNPPWAVLELRARDLADPEDLAARVRGLL